MRLVYVLPVVAATAVAAFLRASPAPAEPAAYTVAPAPNCGSIKGRCTLGAPGGTLPERWKVKIFKDNDKGCGADKERPTERWIVGEGGGLANCLVYIKEISAGKDWPEAMKPEERKALIDQKGCRYLPHVQWIRGATQVVVGNEDQAEHNIHGYRGSLADTQFNFASAPGKTVDDVEKAFLEISGLYLVKCDIHPWMSAFVHVVDHPYYEVTSDGSAGGLKAGEFAMADVPPGTYQVIAWHEGMEESPQEQDGKIAAYVYSPDVTLPAQTVTVEAGKPSEVNFQFEPPKNGGK
jgi:hypothetical protein